MSNNCFAVNYCDDVNCQACYLMEVDEDPLTDSSGEGNTAALKGAGEPNYGTADPPDTGDGCSSNYSSGYYIWDGSNDYAKVTHSVSIDKIGGVNYCLVTWAYPESDNRTNNGMLCKVTDTIDQWIEFSRHNDTFYLASDDGTNKREIHSSQYLKNSWYHVAVDKESGTGYKMYVNGIQDGTAADNNSCANDHDFYLGYHKKNSISYQGRLTQSAGFDRHLSSTEINDTMDNGLAGAVAETFIPKIWMM